ncbi:MAG: bifunctional 5,10-methylene-tetrahydrofolate dehydrogenase/5,10-methylene-tetrahydrofolate cyclohydrolase [Bacteroidales bacterium]|jgi:methylenetetrahydrofolate dehydrogenase (NADP+)/methenyltetrahydrofolate cyclohydrolase|nr:bifunctional 5,10-methylene-tetrahydrofolate dehydrogenase/5,10-methylene-tetrahydrofolate cyclohydrolase [Bacteroidales bacterium]
MKLMDGKLVAEKIKSELKIEVSRLIESGIDPHLAAILVGDDPASQTYVRNKEKACREVGIVSSVYRQSASITEKELLAMIDFINNDPEVHGLIVQLPLPSHINPDKVIQQINPAKDVDGFHPVNVGRMVQGMPSYLPATPFGILKLLEYYKVETEGKNCVILGRSNIVGTPLAILMSRKSYPGNATVTICHSKTKNLEKIAGEADILISAIGQPGFVSADMVKEGAVVIDVGIHRVPSDKTESGYRLIGDVKFDEVSRKASLITPVPGGVGLMTIVSLLMNTVRAAGKEIYP